MLKSKVLSLSGRRPPESIIRFYYLIFIATIMGSIAIQPVMHIADFIWFYGAAEIAAHNSRQVYDAAALNAIIQRVIPLSADFRLNPFVFVYPPQSLFFFAPLTFFSVKSAYHLWTALNILATILFCRICSRQATRPPVSSLVILAMLSASFPWQDTIWEGQPMIWMLLAFLSSYMLAQRRRFFPAALLLCLSAFKPQLSIAPALYLCLLHGKPMLRAFFLAACLVIALVSACYGWHIWIDYMYADIAMADNLHAYDALMSNVRTLCSWLISSDIDVIRIISCAALAASLLCICAIGRAAKKRTAEIQDLGFALILPVSALGSPYLYPHSTLLQAISIYYMYRYGNRAIIYPVLAVNLLAFALLPMQPHHYLMVSRLFIIAQFLLLLWSARLFLRRLDLNPVLAPAHRGDTGAAYVDKP